MPGRDTRRRGTRPEVVGLLPILLLLLASHAASAQGRIERVAAGGSTVEQALTQAAALAETKLSEPACREIFSDFRDTQGRTLQGALDGLGRSGNDYLRGLVFYEGYGRPVCDSREIVAYTSPGSRAVFLCGPQFVEKTHRDPGLAAALLIHEELHSLGLGENPPSSREITARVVARCGK